MEDEVVTQVGDVVVTANKTTGAFTIGIGGKVMFSGSYNFLQQRNYVDPNTGQETDTPLPPELAFQVTALELMSQFLDAIADVPGIPASDSALISSVAADMETAAHMIELGGSLTSARSFVHTSVSIMYDTIGGAIGSMVTGALMGAFGLTATSFTGATGVIGGGLAFLAGYLAAEAFPADVLADITTDMIFLGADAIHDLEQQTQHSLSEVMQDWYAQVMNEIYGDLPQIARPHYNVATVAPVTLGLDAIKGDFRYNVVTLESATSALTVNLDLTGLQDTGGAGWREVATIEGVYGSAFNDTLIGNFAGNLFRGGAGDDYIDGGDGFDFADYSDNSTGPETTTGVVINLNFALQATGDRGADTLVNIEGVIGSDGADTLIGNDQANTLIGGQGDDTISGGGGDDLIIAHGLSGTYRERNYVDGGSGSDTISFSPETMGTTKFGGQYNTVIDLTAGTAYFGLPAANGTMPQTVLSYLTSIENVIGGSGRDTIRGNAEANDLRGNDGADTISGLGGNDCIDGGAGNDILDGGDGIDTLSLLSSSAGVYVSLQSQFAEGDQIFNFENLLGSLFDDELRGTDGANDIRGAAGDDELFGLGGNDTLHGGADDDLIDGGAGDDTLFGEDGADRFIGGGGYDTVDGGLDFDTLVLRGSLDQYSIQQIGNGFVIQDLVGNRDGQIFLTDVEQLELAGGSLYTLPPLSSSLSGANPFGGDDSLAAMSSASPAAQDWFIT